MQEKHISHLATGIRKLPAGPGESERRVFLAEAEEYIHNLENRLRKNGF